MKKAFMTFVLVVVMCFSSVHTLATPTQSSLTLPDIVSDKNIFSESDFLSLPDVKYADAALLMDMQSGRLLYGKDINKRVFPASTTKIMTGILAIEMCSLEEVVTASAKAIAPITIYDSQIGIIAGEKFTMEQLINATLVPSANDAAYVIADHLAGSTEAFAEIMNIKARELGMEDTHFVNPCGMHDDNHYTTAHDLAILAQYAMKNDIFREIVCKASYQIPPTNKVGFVRDLSSTNLFLSSTHHSNSLCTGIKTGHTSKAGYCLVSSAEHEGMELISVVMGCENIDLTSGAYSYIDSKTLYDFGFNSYKNFVIAAPGDAVCESKVFEAKGKTPVVLTVEKSINALLPQGSDISTVVETKMNLPEKISAPITKGTVLGTVTYSYNGTLIGTSDLIAVNDVERSVILHILNIIKKIVSSPFFFIPAILIFLVIYRKKRKCRRRRQRSRGGRVQISIKNSRYR